MEALVILNHLRNPDRWNFADRKAEDEYYKVHERRERFLRLPLLLLVASIAGAMALTLDSLPVLRLGIRRALQGPGDWLSPALSALPRRATPPSSAANRSQLSDGEVSANA
jgi:hypothetical protein